MILILPKSNHFCPNLPKSNQIYPNKLLARGCGCVDAYKLCWIYSSHSIALLYPIWQDFRKLPWKESVKRHYDLIIKLQLSASGLPCLA